MQYLYPAHKNATRVHAKMTALSIACLFSFLFSFSQTTVSTADFINLASFTAKVNNSGSISLTMVTESENNFSHFLLQRSTDGINFQDAALIFSEEGNTQTTPRYYFFTDNAPIKNVETIYYRAVMSDEAGNTKYSDIVAVNPGSAQTALYARLNASQSKLHITIPESWQGKPVSYHIYNARRQCIKQVVCSKATLIETVNVVDLPAGKYIVKAAFGNHSSEQRIVKLNG